MTAPTPGTGKRKGPYRFYRWDELHIAVGQTVFFRDPDVLVDHNHPHKYLPAVVSAIHVLEFPNDERVELDLHVFRKGRVVWYTRVPYIGTSPLGDSAETWTEELPDINE